MTPPIRRILVATDFSDTSDHALEYAHLVARHLGASVHLLHVFVDARVSENFLGHVPVGAAPSARAAALAAAQGALRERSVGMASTQVLVGEDAETIVEFAAQAAIDLIVIGTHGRTGLAHLMMGSVAERVVRAAPCPVLVVPQQAAPLAHAAPSAFADVAGSRGDRVTP